MVEKMEESKFNFVLFFVSILYFCEKKIHNWSIPLFNCEHIIFFILLLK